jgi:hypothetical protein
MKRTLHGTFVSCQWLESWRTVRSQGFGLDLAAPASCATPASDAARRYEHAGKTDSAHILGDAYVIKDQDEMEKAPMLASLASMRASRPPRLDVPLITTNAECRATPFEPSSPKTKFRTVAGATTTVSIDMRVASSQGAVEIGVDERLRASKATSVCG